MCIGEEALSPHLEALTPRQEALPPAEVCVGPLLSVTAQLQAEREVIKSGPPEEIAKAFQELLADEIDKTKIACAKAWEKMGWPSRKDA